MVAGVSRQKYLLYPCLASVVNLTSVSPAIRFLLCSDNDTLVCAEWCWILLEVPLTSQRRAPGQMTRRSWRGLKAAAAPPSSLPSSRCGVNPGKEPCQGRAHFIQTINLIAVSHYVIVTKLAWRLGLGAWHAEGMSSRKKHAF